MKTIVVKKHPLVLRWNHWLNFPLLTLMILSGLAIYWAHAAYILPEEWLESIGLSRKLALGLGWHFALAPVFILNGCVYVLYLIRTRHFRYLFPDRDSLSEAWSVFLHDLGLKKIPLPPQQKYNAAQRLSYTAILFLGILASLTGLAIYKPAQLGTLLALLGGYKAARMEHFIVMIFFMLFFFVHILQVLRAGWNNFRAMVTGLETKDEVQ